MDDREHDIQVSNAFWEWYGHVAESFGTIEDRDAIVRAITHGVDVPRVPGIGTDLVVTSVVEAIAWAGALGELSQGTDHDKAIEAITARMTFPGASQVGRPAPGLLAPAAQAIWTALATVEDA